MVTEAHHMSCRRTEKGGNPPDTPIQLKGLIIQALQTLHGHVGASIPVDILHFSTIVDEDGVTHTSAILRAPHREQVKVWSALTICTGQSTMCCVEKVSTSLLSLAVDSRTFKFPR